MDSGHAADAGRAKAISLPTKRHSHGKGQGTFPACTVMNGYL